MAIVHIRSAGDDRIGAHDWLIELHVPVQLTAIATGNIIANEHGHHRRLKQTGAVEGQDAGVNADWRFIVFFIF